MTQKSIAASRRLRAFGCPSTSAESILPLKAALASATKIHAGSLGERACARSALAAIDRRARGRACCAAIDKDFRALHVRGIVGGQEQHGLGDFLGLAEPAQRDGARDPLVQYALLASAVGAAPFQIGVFAAPGATTLTRMPRGDSSDAITRAIARTPALAGRIGRVAGIAEHGNHRAVEDDRGAVVQMMARPTAR